MRQMAAVQAVLQAAVALPSVRAVFLKGSLARGAGDRYADVDFYCLVDQADLADFLPWREQLLQAYRPVIYLSQADFVGPQLVAVFDDGLHFDLYTVTPERFPLIGSLQVLHDPEHRLDSFLPLQQDHRLPPAQVAERFNEFSFTLLEWQAAWGRQDLVWAARLASHLAGDLGVLLRHRYDPANGLLGSKRLEAVLPVQLKAMLRSALRDSCGDCPPRGVLTLCDLLRTAWWELPPEQTSPVDWRLFELMYRQIAAEVVECP